MAELPLRLFDKTTGRVYLMGTLDGVDTTGMAAAAALPAGTATAVDLEVQYGDKAVPTFGVTAYGGGTGGTGTTTVKPGAPETVTATLSGTDVTVRATAPLQVGTPAYAAIVVGLDGNVDPNPVISPTGEAVFSGLAPGVYTPWAYAFGDGGIGPTQYGASVVIAGAGIPPVVTSNPTISGSSTYGSTLTVALPPATGAVSSAIQWLRDGVVIPGATSNSYALAVADVGKVPGVRVVWTSSDGAITTRTAVYSTVGKATQTASRMPALFLQSDGGPGNGVVGAVHYMNAGAYSIIPSDGPETHELVIDGVSVPLGTRGYTVGTWVPQASDIGKVAVYRHSFTGSAYVNDAVWQSVGYTVIAAASSQSSATITNTTPTTGATPGVMVLLSSISGATADAGTSITITARTDAASTGGVGVWELTAADVTAYNAGTYVLPQGGMVMDIPPTLAQGTTITTGPFAAGTVALVFAPIGSGTYSYTLGLGASTASTTPVSQVAFDNGDLLIFNNGDGLAFTTS